MYIWKTVAITTKNQKAGREKRGKRNHQVCLRSFLGARRKKILQTNKTALPKSIKIVVELLVEDKDMDTNKNTADRAKRRINIIKGQLNGLMRMIENDEYCIDLLTQSSAIQHSLKSLDAVILERHLTVHVRRQFQEYPERAIKELLKVFKKSSRNK